MEIIMISESKLKLMLTREDLSTFDLDGVHLDCGRLESKRMLRNILKYLKEQVGFQTDGCRVLVQLFPSRDGGCELFITKMAEPSSCEWSESAEEDWTSDSAEGSESSGTHSVGVYSFDRLEWLIPVCRRLMEIGYAGNSDAYISDDHRFFLFLQSTDSHRYLPLDEYSFISEYGREENCQAMRELLCEHGRRLCAADAVERLGVL